MIATTQLSERSGTRPDTSKIGPHQQLSQKTTPELWGRLVYEAMSIVYVAKGRSSVSMADSRALLLPKLHGEHGPCSLIMLNLLQESISFALENR